MNSDDNALGRLTGNALFPICLRAKSASESITLFARTESEEEDDCECENEDDEVDPGESFHCKELVAVSKVLV